MNERQKIAVTEAAVTMRESAARLREALAGAPDWETVYDAAHAAVEAGQVLKAMSGIIRRPVRGCICEECTR